MATKKMQKGGIFTPQGRIKSNKTRTVDIKSYGSDASTSRTKRNGDVVTKSINTSRGFAPSASSTKTVTDKEGNKVSEKTSAMNYNRASKKTDRIANNVGRNENDSWAYKTGGMVNSNAKTVAAKKATGKVGGVTKAVSKVAVKTTAPKGRVGGISTAPKTATPKMKMGGMKKKSC